MARNPKTRAGTKPRPQCFIARTIAYPPSIAKPPWARLTKPIKPMVTESPTDTMNSTMPAATPPRSMLATSAPKIMRAFAAASLRGAGPDLLLLARVLDAVDLADDLLEDAAVLHDRLRQVLVHDDVPGDGVDRDGPARAVELPSLEGLQRLVRLDLPPERLGHVDDGGHAVVAADGHEVGRRGGAVLLLPRLDEALVLGVVEIRVVVGHRDQDDRRRSHGLQLGVLGDGPRADQLDSGLAHAERGVGLGDGGRVVAGRHEDEEDVRLLVLGALEKGREVRHGAGAAHRDLVDHLAPIGFEAPLER